jgi:hypothetical protein
MGQQSQGMLDLKTTHPYGRLGFPLPLIVGVADLGTGPRVFEEEKSEIGADDERSEIGEDKDAP